MTHLLELANLRDGYVELVEYVRKHGEKTQPRDIATRELENVTFTVADLTDTLPVGVGRKVNLRVAALEALQLIGGVSTPQLLVAVAPHFSEFQEDDGTFYGAYGNRTPSQFSHVVRKLQSDPDSRQAIVTMWDPTLDNRPGHRDYPCTVAMGFRLRRDRLNLSVLMRSNDVWLGTAYDVFQFTQAQHTIARILDVEVGTYTHTAWSLHMYERDVPTSVKDLDPPQTDTALTDVRGVRSFKFARDLLNNVGAVYSSADQLSESELWYANQVVTSYQRLMA